MKVMLLGTGSPEAYVRRASAGFLVEAGADRILLDCGSDVVDRLLQAGRLPSDITHIIFSHLHSDHMMDYARLVHAAWDEGGRPIKVFGPSPITEISEKLFGPDGVFSHDLQARTELPPSQAVWQARGGSLPRPWPAPDVTEISPRETIEGDGWRLTSCPVPHAQPILTCMALRIDAGGKSVVYSGDAGHNAAFETLCGGADLLLHWCYRLTGDERYPALVPLTPTPVEIAGLAERAGVKRLVLTHFRVQMDADGVHEKVLADLAANFSGEASIAEDLDEIQI